MAILKDWIQYFNFCGVKPYLIYLEKFFNMKNKNNLIFCIKITHVIVTNLIMCVILVGCNSKSTQIEDGYIKDAKCITHSNVLKKTLLFLISDGSSESVTQIIQCSDSTVKHGFAYVTFPYDHIETRDIEWISKFVIDDVTYPVVKRVMTNGEISSVDKTITQIEAIINSHSYIIRNDYIIRDDYQYIFYIDNDKSLIISPQALYLDDTPLEYKEIVDNILSICAPLYPNFGFVNFGDE